MHECDVMAVLSRRSYYCMYFTTASAVLMFRQSEQVIANIRGGGEYGPKWHQAALKGKRHKSYEDVEVTDWLVGCLVGTFVDCLVG